jgi:2-keto-4-pentenoate hydratase
MDSSAVEAAALALRAAYDGSPIEPISDRLLPNTAEAGYAVQDVNTRWWLAQGRRAVGAKIGLTSAAVQQQIGVDEPDFGILFEDMAVADGDEVPFASLHQPRAEGEIVFHLGEDLAGAELNSARVRQAIDWAAPAIEVVASRIDGWRCRIADTVADNASAGLFVVGAPRRPLSEFEPATAGMTLFADDQEVSSGTGLACMGDPLNAVLWLARRFQDVGRPLRAGDLVLSGALGPLVWLAPGVRYRLSIQGLGEASVRFR